MNKLKILWAGEYPLKRAYWFWGLLVPLFFWVIPLQIMMITSESLFFYYLQITIGTPYSFIAMVGIWRSAGRYSGPVIWKFLARLVCVGTVVSFSYNFIILLTRSPDELRRFLLVSFYP